MDEGRDGTCNFKKFLQTSFQVEMDLKKVDEARREMNTSRTSTLFWNDGIQEV